MKDIEQLELSHAADENKNYMALLETGCQCHKIRHTLHTLQLIIHTSRYTSNSYENTGPTKTFVQKLIATIPDMPNRKYPKCPSSGRKIKSGVPT